MLRYEEIDMKSSAIFWDHSYVRRVYDDPAEVVFDRNLELSVGFERAFSSYERDVELATERRDTLATEAALKTTATTTTTTTTKVGNVGMWESVVETRSSKRKSRE
jgi:hypothetical protein